MPFREHYQCSSQRLPPPPPPLHGGLCTNIKKKKFWNCIAMLMFNVRLSVATRVTVYLSAYVSAVTLRVRACVYLFLAMPTYSKSNIKCSCCTRICHCQHPPPAAAAQTFSLDRKLNAGWVCCAAVCVWTFSLEFYISLFGLVCFLIHCFLLSSAPRRRAAKCLRLHYLCVCLFLFLVYGLCLHHRVEAHVWSRNHQSKTRTHTRWRMLFTARCYYLQCHGFNDIAHF